MTPGQADSTPDSRVATSRASRVRTLAGEATRAGVAATLATTHGAVSEFALTSTKRLVAD